MEFKFVYDNGEMKLYEGDSNEEVVFEDLGWTTSDEYCFFAREVFKSFYESMKKMGELSKLHKVNLVTKLELKLSDIKKESSVTF